MVYKFRGWDATGQKGWVYGFLTKCKGLSNQVPAFLYDRFMIAGYHVEEDSIGFFSGLSDRNNVDIYLGDIIQWSKDNKLYVVTFRNGMFYASVEEFNKNIYGGLPLWMLCLEEQPCTVIDNMYEYKKRGRLK